uniref:Uncharacterized protein n=1 Tax=Cyanistes caeruleus TaxID=156563 RepID=A0A8C0U968_CYACU
AFLPVLPVFSELLVILKESEEGKQNEKHYLSPGISFTQISSSGTCRLEPWKQTTVKVRDKEKDEIQMWKQAKNSQVIGTE